jgi:hypothetical protein
VKQASKALFVFALLACEHNTTSKNNRPLLELIHLCITSTKIISPPVDFIKIQSIGKKKKQDGSQTHAFSFCEEGKRHHAVAKQAWTL